MVSHLSTTAWRATTTPFGILALASTTFRIYDRCRKHGLWWDDYWAMVSQLSNLINGATIWLRDDDRHPHSSTEQRIVIFWLSALSFPAVVWFARISIALSIARLTPKIGARQIMYAVSVCFGLALAGLEFHRIIACNSTVSWHHNQTADCYLGDAIGIVSLSTDIPADACLVAMPLHMLWRLRIPRRQRHLLMAIFSANIISSLVGVVYAVFVINAQSRHSPWTRLAGLMAGIKGTVTLLICNLLVVGTYVYCVFLKEEDEEVSEPSETRSSPTTCFSTLTVISDPDVLEFDTSSRRSNPSTQTVSSISALPPVRTSQSATVVPSDGR